MRSASGLPVYLAAPGRSILDFARNDKREGAALLQVVRRNLELVAVGIAEINRVRDFVILKLEFDSVLFQFPLRTMEILAIRAKRQMKHSNFAVRRRLRFLVAGNKANPGFPFPMESGDPVHIPSLNRSNPTIS